MQRNKLETAAAGQGVVRALCAAVLLACQPSPALPGEEESDHHVNGVGMKMVLIPNGSFTMGTRQPRVDGWNEQPAHRVTISRPFYISDREVTIEQFQQFRPDAGGSRTAEPAITGISWHDAVAFCKWLSEKEGKTYRLPTEAEWEYAARAGTDTPYWQGEEPPEPGSANAWGLRNVHWGASEWCYDWYGPYSAPRQVDPVGPANGMAKVIRGGGLDQLDSYYARSAHRAGYGPNFASRPAAATETPKHQILAAASLPGLVGLLYGNDKMDRVDGMEIITSLNRTWGRERGNDWAARWSGVLLAPATAEVTFHVAADFGVRMTLDAKKIIDWAGSEKQQSATVHLERGKKYLLAITYCHRGGEKSYLGVQWSWSGQPKTELPEALLLHSPQQLQNVQQIADRVIVPHAAIGFRVVQAALPATEPALVARPFVQECIVQRQPRLAPGPHLDRPWYRRRPLLPIPPDNTPRADSRRAGLHPAIMNHNHSPALAVCPNGDLLMVIYTSEREYEPEVSLLATRLRFGAEQWDMPEMFADFPAVNDHAPLLHTEEGTMFLFWGNPRFDAADPFQWMTSADSGATWSEVHFPRFAGQIGPHSRQPINSAFRGPDGRLYLSSDAVGGTSLLWATKDDGKTWYDTGGRSGGRHTAFALLKDGRILGMGGKSTDIDGYMPKSISADGGKTWQVSKTPFAALGSNQRPCLFRLQSGRLFFCGDFQHRRGDQPREIDHRGSYVALSSDEGETWVIKRLAGALVHERDRLFGTLGYSVARQAPNGIIHLITTMNHPCLHFELNEAWILDEQAGFDTSLPVQMAEVKSSAARYPSGKLMAKWAGGVSPAGAYLLHGRQSWFYGDGQRQWDVRYQAGRKVGHEVYWDRQGGMLWQWQHQRDGASIWTQYWPNGRRKSESMWRNFRLHGVARLWDRTGESLGAVRFVNGSTE